MDTNSYLYLVLVPVAEVFRSRFPKGKAPFNATRNNYTCRIKFTNLLREAPSFRAGRMSIVRSIKKN